MWSRRTGTCCSTSVPAPTGPSPRRRPRAGGGRRLVAVHGEAIYGSSPWVVFGEGPTAAPGRLVHRRCSGRVHRGGHRFTEDDRGRPRLRLRDRARPPGGRPHAHPQLRLGQPACRPSDRRCAGLWARGSSRSGPAPASTWRSCCPTPSWSGPGGAVVRIELAREAAESRIDFFHGLNILATTPAFVMDGPAAARSSKCPIRGSATYDAESRCSGAGLFEH